MRVRQEKGLVQSTAEAKLTTEEAIPTYKLANGMTETMK